MALISIGVVLYIQGYFPVVNFERKLGSDFKFRLNEKIPLSDYAQNYFELAKKYGLALIIYLFIASLTFRTIDSTVNYFTTPELHYSSVNIENLIHETAEDSFWSWLFSIFLKTTFCMIVFL